MLAIGDRVGSYRVIAAHPAGGFRAASDKARVHLELGDAVDWRVSAVSFMRLTSQVAALEHPGIAKIVDRGVIDHRPWIATEHADGMLLSDVMARRVLAVDETLDLVRDLASILMHLHERGLVHDGVKPQAITLRTGARPFPIQLGSWRELRNGNGAEDVHALGVLAYRAITGRFPGLAVPELVPGIPGGVSALIVGMLAADPEARPTAAAVFAEVARLCGDRSLTGPRFARPRWTPQPDELHPVSEAITLPLKQRA
jgi:serine/threonine-protein kinase